jgi:exodeoxyribonuclease-3
MKLITWNVNGIRAIERKNELNGLIEAEKPDFLLLQETKANPDQLGPWLTDHPDYVQHYHAAEKKGYAGTALWVTRKVFDSLGEPVFRTDVPHMPNADEGRVSWLSFDHDGRRWELLSIYFPNGGKSDEAWRQKLEFYDCIHEHMNRLRDGGGTVVVGGDMNVAHTEIDLARPVENDGKIGFHPDERAWMDRVTADGWVDVWRERNPGVTEVYSYWDMVTRARDRNVGWRIDYFFIDRSQLDDVSEIQYLNDRMGSDHCPLRLVL